MLNKGARRLTVRGSGIPCQEMVLMILDRSASMKSEHTTGSLPMGKLHLYNKFNWVHGLTAVGCSLRHSIIHKPLTLP